MRRSFSIRHGVWLALLPAVLGALFLVGAAQARSVDLALVLLIDDSGSIDDRESRMQLSGYASAFRSPAVVEALTRGPRQAIAVSVVMFTDQVRVVVPWRVLDGRQSAEALAAQIERLPRMAGSGTHIAQGLQFSINHLSRCPHEFSASTIDISADGWDNQFAPPIDGAALLTGLLGAVTGINIGLPSGPDPVGARKLSEMRNYAKSRGITINCIAIEDPTLRDYFSRYVMGGPGAFTTFAPSFRAFTEAIQRKLLREIKEGLKVSEVRQKKASPARVAAPKPEGSPAKAKQDQSPGGVAAEPGSPAAAGQTSAPGMVEEQNQPTPRVIEVAPPVELLREIMVREARSDFPLDEVQVEVLPPAELLSLEVPEGRPGLILLRVKVPAGQTPRVSLAAPLFLSKEAILAEPVTEVSLERLPLKIAW